MDNTEDVVSLRVEVPGVGGGEYPDPAPLPLVLLLHSSQDLDLLAV